MFLFFLYKKPLPIDVYLKKELMVNMYWDSKLLVLWKTWGFALEFLVVCAFDCLTKTLCVVCVYIPWHIRVVCFSRKIGGKLRHGFLTFYGPLIPPYYYD